MTTIVLNTKTATVSEYDWTFQSITPTHAGDATGLYLLGGGLDGTLPIDASITTGTTLWGSSLKKRVGVVYFSMLGAGLGQLRVIAGTVFSYLFNVRSSGQSRKQPGQGISENFLGFGYDNVAGADFQIDRIEVDLGKSTNRRVG